MYDMVRNEQQWIKEFNQRQTDDAATLKVLSQRRTALAPFVANIAKAAIDGLGAVRSLAHKPRTVTE